MRHNARVMLLVVVLAGCFHSGGAPRPARHVNYWEALADLHPADALEVKSILPGALKTGVDS